MGIFNNTEEDQKYTEKQAEVSRNDGFLSTPRDVELVDEFLNNDFFNRPLFKLFDIGEWQNRVNSMAEPINNSMGDIFGVLSKNYEELKQSGRSGTKNLKSYPIPSVSMYEKCMAGNGLSVWDDKGWWRCLFPRDSSGKQDGLSKEDVLGDSSNKYGLFFNDFTGYLSWKSQMRKLAVEKRQNELKALRSRAQDGQDSNAVISNNRSVFFKTLQNGDAEEITEISKQYANGTVEKSKFRKLFPKNGDEPIVEQLEGAPVDLAALESSGDSKSWFWK